MGSILRNNRRMFWEILNRIIGRKNRIIGTGLIITLGAHAQKGYGTCLVCLSVCLLPLRLLRAGHRS